MDYSFDMVEKLYKEYAIGQNDATKKLLVFNRKNMKTYDFNSELASYVKFAHTWEYATEFKSEETDQKQKIKNAFSDTSRIIYNEVMQANLASIHMQGRLFTKEELIQALGAKGNENLRHIIEGLYDKQVGLASLNQWCLYACGQYKEENNSIGRNSL